MLTAPSARRVANTVVSISTRSKPRFAAAHRAGYQPATSDRVRPKEVPGDGREEPRYLRPRADPMVTSRAPAGGKCRLDGDTLLPGHGSARRTAPRRRDRRDVGRRTVLFHEWPGDPQEPKPRGTHGLCHLRRAAGPRSGRGREGVEGRR